MRDDEQYAAAVENCEMAARSHGHTLGMWYLVDERLHAAMCVVCDEMVLVARSGDEERWRLGGRALHEDCFRQEEEDQGSVLGA
jgi:hypothetical protein